MNFLLYFLIFYFIEYISSLTHKIRIHFCSRVLVPTRSEKVVSIMQASFTYQLGILSDEGSWKLFQKIAFGHGGAVKTHELGDDIGRRIVAELWWCTIHSKGNRKFDVLKKKMNMSCQKLQRVELFLMLEIESNLL